MSTIKRLRLLFVLFIFISVFAFSSKAFAATVVTGDIETDTTWTLAQSPYIVENNISVWPGKTLTIEAGVVVKIKSEFSFVGTTISIFGRLEALGDEGNKIYFTSFYDDEIGGDTDSEEFCYEDIDEEGNILEICEVFDYGDPFVGDWGGIYFHHSVDSNLKNVSFRYARNVLTTNSSAVDFENLNVSDSVSGLTAYENSLVNINGATFDHIQEDAFVIFNDSSLDLSEASLASVANGFAIYNDSIVTIRDSSLACAGDGIVVYNNSVLNISDGSISCNHDGMVIYNGIKAVIEDVKISNASDAGIIAFDRVEEGFANQISVTKSEITGNEYGFVVFNTSISAHNNKIHNNFNHGVMAFSALTPNQFNFGSNYWGDSSGPSHSTNPAGSGDVVSDNVLFTPFLTSDPLVECCSSVLFLPGLKASRLYKQKSILGIPVEDQLWEPNVNADVEDLYLNPDGTSKNSNIYTKDIIKETNVPIPMGALGQNVYKSFSKMMDVLLDEHKIGEWKEFAYDWRQSVDDIVHNGTKYKNGNMSLVSTLQSLIDSSKNGKVTIIAHSNGGLLAKALLKKLQDDKNAGRNNLIDSVDVLILVAVPEIGTAVAVPAMLHGYDQDILGGWIVDETRARELGRNMLGAFGLLPSKEYINHVSASPATFSDNAIPSQVTTKLVKTFGDAINSYAEYKSFLSGEEGRTNPQSGQTNLPISLASSLFNKAETLHNDIDAFVPPASLRVIEVAGWGLDTVASFEYYPKECTTSLGCGFILDQRPKFTIDGDGTVVTPSAHYMGFIGSAEKYWVDFPNHNGQLILGLRRNREHKDILEVDSLNNFIQSILEKKDVIFDGVFKNSQPTGDSSRLRLSIHSPVTLDAYDIEGNHTGKICPPSSDFCYKEENIPNSSYLEFGEGKYLNLPEDKAKSIKLQGTDVGTFTYKSEKVLPGGTSTVSSFVDIPVTTQTQAEIVLDPTTQIPQLKIDVTGDGVNDFTLTPNATFEPIVYLQIMKATIDSLDLPQAKIKAFDVRVDNIIKLIQKGKIDKAKLKADKFKSVLEKKLAKPDPKKPKPKKLSKTDAQLLLDMLNKLLDNIN